VAWLLTVLLHGVAAFGLRGLPSLEAAPARPHAPEPIQLVFSPPHPAARPSEEPRLYSPLPANRADKAPEKAALLSNVTSRARDFIPGGDAALPHLAGEGDVPQVQLAPDKVASAATPTAKQAAPQPADPGKAGAAAPWQKSVLLTRGPTAKPIPEGVPRLIESSNLPQLAMDNPGGNAELTGDVSLNTIAWDYAPWLDRFRSRLMEKWFAPMAYRMGILKDGGWAVIEIEISRSGQMTRFELLEQQGHPSLITAAQNAVRSTAPFEALPSDFPEPTLILRLRMVYPQIRPR
jgi:outer membrane biosynthesis protein TonB